MKALCIVLMVAFCNLAVAADVVPILKGETASQTGFLVIEDRYVKLLKSEITISGAEAEVEAERRVCKKIEGIYDRRLDEAYDPPKWYRTAEFGFVGGVVITLLAGFVFTQIR
jgi:hypothetical protein